jgi:hypothetical protein
MSIIPGIPSFNIKVQSIQEVEQVFIPTCQWLLLLQLHMFQDLLLHITPQQPTALVLLLFMEVQLAMRLVRVPMVLLMLVIMESKLLLKISLFKVESNISLSKKNIFNMIESNEFKKYPMNNKLFNIKKLFILKKYLFKELSPIIMQYKLKFNTSPNK